nr:pentatricopeptide repeat-containing protein At4g04790, mitochondrial-like isoform X1 [Ipomoea batatas]
MPVSKAKNLASLLRSAAALAKTTAPTASGDIAAKKYFSSVRSSASTASESTQNRFVHSSNTHSRSFNSSSKPLSGAFDGCWDDYHGDHYNGSHIFQFVMVTGNYNEVDVWRDCLTNL